MKLLDTPLSQLQKGNELDLLRGNINRICVSDDIEEIISSLGFATDRLHLIAYSRIKKLKLIDEHRKLEVNND